MAQLVIYVTNRREAAKRSNEGDIELINFILNLIYSIRLLIACVFQETPTSEAFVVFDSQSDDDGPITSPL